MDIGHDERHLTTHARKRVEKSRIGVSATNRARRRGHSRTHDVDLGADVGDLSHQRGIAPEPAIRVSVACNQCANRIGAGHGAASAGGERRLR